MVRKMFVAAALMALSGGVSAAGPLPGVVVPTGAGVALISSLAPNGVPASLGLPALALVGQGFATYSPLVALGVGVAGPALQPVLNSPLPGLEGLP